MQPVSPSQRRSASAATPAFAPPIVHDVLRGGGQPLEAGVRARMEPRFGHSFADVRVHADGRAADSARAVGAHAYAVGTRMVFGAGRYAPGSAAGDRLIAHELAHVVQQRGAASVIQPKLEIGAAGDAAEREADAAAERVTAGAAAGTLRAGGAALRRRAVPDELDPLGTSEHEEGPEQEADNSTGAAAGDTALFDQPQDDASPGDAAAGEEEEDAGADTEESTVGESRDPEPAGDLPDPSLLGTPPAGRRAPGPRRPAPATPPPRARRATPAAKVPTKACKPSVASTAVVVDHRVSPDRIEKPGDTVTVTATFACVPFSGGRSLIQDAKGASLGLEAFFPRTGRFVRTWNGKHQKSSQHPKLMADDGTYTLKIDSLKYAVKGKVDLFASGPGLVSPPITVAVRSFTGTGKTHPHFTKANADFLGKIIRTEIGTGNTDEQEAIAWAVRNEMVRLNVNSVEKAANAFAAHSGKAATAADVALAERILKKPMSDDTTSGAIMWWSPSKFPAPGNPCIIAGVKGDCGGPAVKVTTPAGKVVTVQSPKWHGYMTRVNVAGVSEWNLIMVRP